MSVPAPEALWATVNECTEASIATVGVRASMPGDSDPEDTEYMQVRLQYLNKENGDWEDLPEGNSGYLTVGRAASEREDGRTFDLAPTREPSELRGVVEFQWRQGARVMFSAERTTTAGHSEVDFGQPPGYSAAGCVIG
jgi:hypothetical protein